MRQGKQLGILLAALACVVAMLAMVAPVAQAEDEGAVGSFQLKGTHGFTVSVVALTEPNKGGQGEVLVLAVRKGAAVVYNAPATVTPPTSVTPATPAGVATSIQADLHSLGRIALNFKASGGTKTYASPCDKGTVTVPDGTFEGSFELHGEEGYTEASTTQVPFDLRPLIDLSCASASSARRGSGGASLVLNSKKRRLSLLALKGSPRGRVQVAASLGESREGISIGRAVTGSTGPAALLFDSKLRTASLRLGSPFSGRATFNRAAAPAKRLRGNLKLDFPGKSNVKLTGSDVRAKLSHAGGSSSSLQGETGLLGAFVTPWVTNAPLPAILR